MIDNNDTDTNTDSDWCSIVIWRKCIHNNLQKSPLYAVMRVIIEQMVYDDAVAGVWRMEHHVPFNLFASNSACFYAYLHNYLELSTSGFYTHSRLDELPLHMHSTCTLLSHVCHSMPFYCTSIRPSSGESPTPYVPDKKLHSFRYLINRYCRLDRESPRPGFAAISHLYGKSSDDPERSAILVRSVTYKSKLFWTQKILFKEIYLMLAGLILRGSLTKKHVQGYSCAKYRNNIPYLNLLNYFYLI